MTLGSDRRRLIRAASRHLESKATAADQQLLLVIQDDGRGPDERPVGALQVLEIPAVLAVLEAPADLRVPARDSAVVGYREVPLDSADHKRIGANPHDFPGILAVVEHVQQGHRRPQARAVRRGILLGARRPGRDRDINRLS